MESVALEIDRLIATTSDESEKLPEAVRLPLADDVGEASYAVTIKPDEIIHVTGSGRMRVLDLVPVPEEDSPFTGFLNVEPEARGPPS